MSGFQYWEQTNLFMTLVHHSLFLSAFNLNLIQLDQESVDKVHEYNKKFCQGPLRIGVVTTD